MKTIKGNLITMALEGSFNVIVHGCNCENIMGAGIAEQIATKFPKAKKIDKEYKLAMSKVFGYNHPLHMLGNMSLCEIGDLLSPEPMFIIANLYTQVIPGPYFRMQEGLVPALSKLNFIFRGKKIGFPMIGAGIGGGDWKSIEYMIKALMKDCDVTIVEYEPKT